MCASIGSACTSGYLDTSHVLLAIGLPHKITHGSLRMTLSEDTTLSEIDFVVDELKKSSKDFAICRRCMRTLLRIRKKVKNMVHPKSSL